MRNPQSQLATSQEPAGCQVLFFAFIYGGSRGGLFYSGCALGLFGWFVGPYVSATLSSFSIIVFRCVLLCCVFVVIAIITCVVGVVFVPAFVVPYKSSC